MKLYGIIRYIFINYKCYYYNFIMLCSIIGLAELKSFTINIIILRSLANDVDVVHACVGYYTGWADCSIVILSKFTA